jgi:two-component system invasion response regulator UvrY
VPADNPENSRFFLFALHSLLASCKIKTIQMKKIRIVIIDDHTLLRQTWAFVLNADPRFTVLAETGSAEEGIRLCRELTPDIALLDINLPDMNGVEATPLILKYAPGTKIIAVSLHTQPMYTRKMVKNGALGYVTKSSPKAEMTAALLEVFNGKKYICSEIKNIVAANMLSGNEEEAGLNLLSSREMEIIDLVKQGLSSKEIAAQKFISVKTVEVHRYNILRKLKLRNSAGLVNYLHQHAVC